MRKVIEVEKKKPATKENLEEIKEDLVNTQLAITEVAEMILT